MNPLLRNSLIAAGVIGAGGLGYGLGRQDAGEDSIGRDEAAAMISDAYTQGFQAGNLPPEVVIEDATDMLDPDNSLIPIAQAGFDDELAKMSGLKDIGKKILKKINDIPKSELYHGAFAPSTAHKITLSSARDAVFIDELEKTASKNIDYVIRSLRNRAPQYRHSEIRKIFDKNMYSNKGLDNPVKAAINKTKKEMGAVARTPYSQDVAKLESIQRQMNEITAKHKVVEERVKSHTAKRHAAEDAAYLRTLNYKP